MNIFDESVKNAKKLKDRYWPSIKKNIDVASDKAIEKFDEVSRKTAEKSGFSASDITRDEFMLKGRFAKKGYDWWWHNFTGHNKATGEEKSFFVEYFCCNPALAEDEPVLGQLKENKLNGKKPSYVMVKCGAWGEGAKQLHRFFAWKDVKIVPNAPFSLEAADCFVSEGRISGSVSVSPEDVAEHPEYMCDSGSMKWNLSVDKKIPFNVGYGASKAMRTAEAFEMFWHAEGMKTEYTGVVEYDGEDYIVSADTSFGYADKNWGGDFTSPWVWLSSNNLTSRITGQRLKNSVFDIGGGRPCIAGLELDRKLLGAMYYEGKELEFNFSKLWMVPTTKFNCYETDDEIVWHIAQTNAAYEMITNIRCKKSEMLLINYEAPDGFKLHNRLWNGGTGKGVIKLYKKNGNERELMDEIEALNVGCEWGEMDIYED